MRTWPRRQAAALAVWVLLIAAVLAWGHVLGAAGRLPADPFPPFHAGFRPRILPLWPVAGVAVLAVAVLPWAARTLPWRSLLASVWAGGAVWAVTLAVSEGVGALAHPLTTRYEYLAVLPAVGDDPLRWLHTFTAELPGYPVQVRGHPPLTVLIFWTLARLGLTGPGWAAALVIAAGTFAGVAVAVTVRATAGEEPARRAAPFLTLLPAATFVATTADALFLGVSAGGVALLALAGRRAGVPDRFARRRGAGTVPGSGARVAVRVMAVAAGTLLGGSLYLSYGLVPVGALAAAVLALRPSARVVGWAVGGVGLVGAGFAVGGFWWPAGVAATHAEWAAGVGAARPYGYFLLGDLAILAVLVGPAAAVGLARLRDRRLWVLVGAALVAVAALDLSGVTRGEVGRIWLPYMPWIVAATAALRPPGRGWLAAQAMVALLVQGLLNSPW